MKVRFEIDNRVALFLVGIVAAVSAIGIVMGAVPDPGHGAETIGPGTFSGGSTDIWNFPGKVGINNPNPGSRLDVIGNAGIKGTLTVEGNVTLDGNGNVSANKASFSGGVEPNWDSGWVYYDRASPGQKTLTHNLNTLPRQIQWWYSPGNPGTWEGPVAWSKQDDWSNPIGVWVTPNEIKFTIWNNRDLYRAFNGASWEDYTTGYYRIMLWK